MEIMQVMGTLVCTFRVGGLDHMHLRILKNNKGKKLVAVDPCWSSRRQLGLYLPVVLLRDMPVQTTPFLPT
jgi:hypothetical protein